MTSKGTNAVDGDAISLFAYAYDALDLVRTLTTLDGVGTCAYGNMNRLLSDGEFEYACDANGNLTSKTSATEAFSYVWNQRGEMLSCVASTGERWDYEYDVFGALIAVTRTDAAGNVERTEYWGDPNAELSSVVSSFDGDVV